MTSLKVLIDDLKQSQRYLIDIVENAGMDGDIAMVDEYTKLYDKVEELINYYEEYFNINNSFIYNLMLLDSKTKENRDIIHEALDLVKSRVTQELNDCKKVLCNLDLVLDELNF